MGDWGEPPENVGRERPVEPPPELPATRPGAAGGGPTTGADPAVVPGGQAGPPTTTAPRGDGRPAPRRTGRHWLLAFAGFFLMFAAWSVAAPYNGTPDELDHIIRAAGVAGGQIAPAPAAATHGGGAFQTIPAGLFRTNCWVYESKTPASCGAPPGSSRTPIVVGTGAGRYHPAYYAAVGWPLRLWPGWPGVILARLVSAAMSAALLAAALVVIMRYSPHRFMLAGLVVVVTPMAAQMASAINPSGLEIAAGITLFAAAVPLLRGGLTAPPRSLVALVGVCAILMAMLRTTGPVYLLGALLALALPLRRAQVRRALRIPRVRWWGLALGITLVTSAAWIILMREAEVSDYRYGRAYRRGQALLVLAERWRVYLDEMVGVTSWLDTRMAMPAYLVWEAAAATLIVGAVALGNWPDRLRLLGLVFVGAIIPSITQIAYVPRTGFILQGRYLLPILAGVVLLAAFILERRGVGARRGSMLTRLFLVALLPIQVVCLAYTMVRWQSGLPGIGSIGPTRLNPFAGPWHPVLGSVTPFLLQIAGLVTFGVLVWRATPGERIADAPPARDRVPPVTPDPAAAGAGPEAVTSG